MKAIFAEGSNNVGDDLNAWLWPALLGDIEAEQSVVLGIGTLLNEEFCNRLNSARKICVMGTGAGYGSLPKVDDRWCFYAVRGKRTAAALKLEADTAVADSAYFLASLDWHGAREGQQGDVVVIPHHRSLRYLDWADVCQRAGVRFLSPLTPPAEFIKAVHSARLVLTEAMHGAILADIVRAPWKAFSFGRQFNGEKWLDWAEMFELDHEIEPISGFYDPTVFGPDRPLHYHLSKHLKEHLSRISLGRRKWRKMTPPAFSVEKAKDKLASALARLSNAAGFLSRDEIMLQRVELLYQRLGRMRADFDAPFSAPLGGDPYAFLRKFAPSPVTPGIPLQKRTDTALQVAI